MLLQEETDTLRRTGIMRGSEQEERPAAFPCFRDRGMEGQLPLNTRRQCQEAALPARRHVQMQEDLVRAAAG